MNLTDHFRRQFSYDAWANLEVVSAMRSQGVDARALQLFAHILAAERLWLERLKELPQSRPVWPELSLEKCATDAAEMSELWREYLDAVTEEKLAQRISYRNSKGEPWTSSVNDILTHVLMHSTYHRGQIASHMRETEKIPAYTDFIHSVRQGLVK